MDQRESIKRLESYIKALNEIDNTRSHVKSMERKVRQTNYAPVKQYMLGRFLWPFLVGATFVLLILCAVGDNIFAENPNPGLEMLFIFGLTIVYIIASFFIAKAIQNKRNKVLLEEQAALADSEMDRRKKLLEQYEATLKRQESVIEDMEEYLPAVCRNAESATAIRNMIKLGKAETIEEAVRLSLEG